MILLDTHVLVWLDQGSEQLGERTRKLIEQAWQKEELAVSTISFWEIGRMVQRGRLGFDGDLSGWRVALINSGFRELVADGATAISAAALSGFDGDAADRLIGATALSAQARLVTADQRFLGYRKIRTVNATN